MQEGQWEGSNGVIVEHKAQRRSVGSGDKAAEGKERNGEVGEDGKKKHCIRV